MKQESYYIALIKSYKEAGLSKGEVLYRIRKDLRWASLKDFYVFVSLHFDTE